MRVLLRVLLNRLGCSAIGVAFSQDWVNGTAEHFCEAGSERLFIIGLRIGREIRNLVTGGL